MDRGIYHVIKLSLLGKILEQGIVPKCGPDAFATGQEGDCINAYTSRVAVRDALMPKGDYMVTHRDASLDELCVLSIVSDNICHQLIQTHCSQMCELRRVIKPTEFIVLDTRLKPISSMELATLAAG